jgi:hypothetical protein
MRRARALLLAVALLAVAPSARADAEGFKQHMSAGQKLVEDENLAGARAEFEAAYAAQPRAQALLEVAACERAMLRYPQAIAALERALSAHGGDLSEAERGRARAAVEEMRAQLGHVEITLSPAGATLRVDGEDQPQGARKIALGPGTHRLEARLAGHAPAAQTISLDSGETARASLTLKPEAGPVQADVVVPPAASPRGAYLLAGVVIFVPLPPTDFTGTAPGVSVGARAGYRLTSVVGLEGSLDYARYVVSGTGRPSYADLTPELRFEHQAVRGGVHLRLMTTAERVRFVQTLGGGVMGDFTRWTPGASGPARQGKSGANGFALAETGIELDIRGGLIGVLMQNLIGTSGGLNHDKHDAYTAETYAGPQYAIGFGLRGGYRFW